MAGYHLALLGQLGAFAGCVCVCLLCGLYSNNNTKLWESSNQCLFRGYGKTGLAYATIALDGLAALFLLVSMPLTLMKKEEGVKMQLGVTGLACLGICIGSILIGALIAVMVDDNRHNTNGA